VSACGQAGRAVGGGCQLVWPSSQTLAAAAVFPAARQAAAPTPPMVAAVAAGFSQQRQQQPGRPATHSTDAARQQLPAQALSVPTAPVPATWLHTLRQERGPRYVAAHTAPRAGSPLRGCTHCAKSGVPATWLRTLRQERGQVRGGCDSVALGSSFAVRVCCALVEVVAVPPDLPVQPGSRRLCM